MNWYNILLWQDTFEYSSNQPIERLKAEIIELLEKTKNKDVSVNMEGKFTGQYKFEISPKWQSVRIRGFERKEAYLQGTLCSLSEKTTRITITIRPNISSIIFFIVFLVVGAIPLIYSFTDELTGSFLITENVLIFIFPGIMLFEAIRAKRRLRETFVKTFQLIALTEKSSNIYAQSSRRPRQR